MNILLINPPAENTKIGNNPQIIDEERGFNPPIGLLYIASCIEKFTKHNVSVIDAQAEEINYSGIEEVIRQQEPDIVGITAMTFTLIDVIKTASIVKKTSKDIIVVLGGPHVYIYPNETINMPQVDMLVLGEGEGSFVELIENIGNFDKLKNIPGLVFKNNGKIISTGQPKVLNDLDSIPFPARHLTPYKKYSSLMAKRSPVTTMITSRGCPYQCLFCNRPHLGKKFRARSAKNVVDEMESCIKMGINEFLLYDDTFNIDRQRVLDVCDEIIDRKLEIGWDIRARIDMIDEETLKKLKKANCERIHYGVEAGTDRVLKILNKGITISQVKEAFNMTKDAGISTLAYFMIGSPTETREDILETIKVSKELDPDFVHITITTPFPDTPLYKQGLEKGVFKKDFWQEFASKPTKEFQPEYWQETLTTSELTELLKEAYKSFYIRPYYILKELLKVRSFSEFKRKVGAGLKVLGL
ncbi:MAG: B12-binding domain-containing radical SAM protein [Elusimicrobia bacterium]|nr:B12-binding domain-containing radical SAM protein [Candidatus Liberimonas magnetica]